MSCWVRCRNIDHGNQVAIAKLIDLIENNRYKYEIAIKLVEKIKNHQDRIRTSKDISQYYERKILFAAEILYSIAPENKIAHDNLIDLIQNSSDEYTRDKALNILIEIVDNKLTERIIVNFQKYLISEKYEVESQIKQYLENRSILPRPLFNPLYDKCRTNCWHFEQYYQLMWFCSNNISYNRFYQAWHKNKLSFLLNMVWQKVLLKLKIHTRL